MCSKCTFHHRSPQERFWLKVNKTETCWFWTASEKPNGYGQFGVGGKPVYAHRFAYEFLVGPISEGQELDHLCRVRHCVNPAHLEPVSHRENILRGETGAYNSRKTHCAQGHPFDAANTYRPPKHPERRVCRACKRDYIRDYQPAYRARREAGLLTKTKLC